MAEETQVTKEEIQTQIEELVAKKAKAKKAEKIAELDAQIVELTNQFEALGGNLEDIGDGNPPTEIEEPLKRLFFKEPFYSVELNKSFKAGQHVPASKEEFEALKKFDVGAEVYSTLQI